MDGPTSSHLPQHRIRRGQTRRALPRLSTRGRRRAHPRADMVQRGDEAGQLRLPSHLRQEGSRTRPHQCCEWPHKPQGAHRGPAQEPRRLGSRRCCPRLCPHGAPVWRPVLGAASQEVALVLELSVVHLQLLHRLVSAPRSAVRYLGSTGCCPQGCGSR